MPRPLKIWINTGEISGDLHGALLYAALKSRDPSLNIMGMGGPALRAEGMPCPFDVEELSVMGFTEVIAQLPHILKLLKRIEDKLREEKPDALVVVDAPSFHFQLIKKARMLGIPVYYFISPKIWAWKQRRTWFIKENVRRMLCILPFEVEFYKRFGMTVDYVGNPLLDEMNLPELERITPISKRIGLLPGSRKREITSLLPQFGIAAQKLLAQDPQLQFHCMTAPGRSEADLRTLWPAEVPITFHSPEVRYPLMRSCQMILAASGTAVLETALAGTPTIITYKVSPVTYALGRLIVKVKFIGLPNLIAGRSIFPELLQQDCNGENLARVAWNWLKDDGAALQAVRADLRALRELVGKPGATDRAAQVILNDLGAVSQ